MCGLKVFALCHVLFHAVAVLVRGVVTEVPVREFDYERWNAKIHEVAPLLESWLLKDKLQSPGFLASFLDFSGDERRDALKSLRGRVPTINEAVEWNSVIESSIPFAQGQRSRTLQALNDPSKRALPSTSPAAPLDTIEILRGFQHRRGEDGWVPRASKKAPAIPKPLEREKWVRAAVEIVLSSGMPLVARLQDSGNQDGLLLRLCGGLRATTIKRMVQVMRKLVSWLGSSFGVCWPENVMQVLDYIVELAREPCAPGVPGMVQTSLRFFERMGGTDISLRMADDSTLASVIKDIVVDLKTARGVRERKKSPPILLAMLIALEFAVTCLAFPIYLRLHSWTRCIRVWASLRWSDLANMPPRLARFGSLGLSTVITQTKTTGPGKRVEVLHAHVSLEAWVMDCNWLTVGWRLFESFGLEGRDFWMPLPTADLDAMSLPWREPSFMDTSALSRLLFGKLLVFQASSRVNGESKYSGWIQEGGPSVVRSLFFGGAHNFWAEHGDRSTLPSWAHYLRIGKEVIDMLGRWSPQGSDEYMRTSRTTVLDTQALVARRLREHDFSTGFGESDTTDKYRDFLLNRGCTAEEAESQIRLLKLVWWGFETPTIAEPPSAGDSEVDLISDEDHEGWNLGSPGGPPLHADVGEAPISEVSSEEEIPSVPVGSFVISREKAGKHRTVHQVGRCYRIPGTHYQFFEVISKVQAQEGRLFEKTCKDCFRARKRKKSQILNETSELGETSDTSSSEGDSSDSSS